MASSEQPSLNLPNSPDSLDSLDSPTHENTLRDIITAKILLKNFYQEHYNFYRDIIAKCPNAENSENTDLLPIYLELGSGAGFVKQSLPQILTSDYLAYQGVDKIIDACHLPFENNTVNFIGMVNVLHHIPDTAAFFKEAQRVLVPGGRIAIVDQHHGWLSRFILKYAHHEPYRPKAKQWAFPSKGPLSDANGALAWIIFKRDKNLFSTLFPNLQCVNYTPHTPLRYWLIGGLKKWCLVPNWLEGFIKNIDKLLLKISPQFGSFVNIEIVKKSAY